MNRHVKLAIELVGGVFAVVAALFAVAAGRLSAGPVPLDALAPYLAASLANPASGVHVAIEHVLVALGSGLRLELVAHGVELRVGETGPHMALDEVAVDFSLGAALRGAIVPTRVVLDRPVLHLARDKDGTFHLGIGESDVAASEAGLRQVLHDLAAPPNPRAPLGLLTEVVVRHAGFVFDDAALGVVWRAGPADLDLHRGADGMRGAVKLAVESGGHRSQIVGDVDYVRATGALEARLGFGDLEPAAWAQAVPALAPLAALALPVSGVVRATLDPARAAIVTASCALRLGTGMLRLAQLPGGAVAVSSGTLAAAYDPAAGSVTIEHAALDLDGLSVAASGTIAGVGRGLLAGAWPTRLDASLALEARDVPVADLARLWPPALAPHARRWVTEHVRAGVAPRAAAQLGLDVDFQAPEAVAVRQLSGTVDYRGLTVDYFGKLPPARGIDGTGSFDLGTVTLAPIGAAVLGIHAADAKITLSKLDTDDPSIAVALALNGPLADAITVLDAEPLRYARALGLEARGVGGDFTARVNVAFPLVDHLAWRQVTVSADAKLAGVSVPNAVLGRDLSDGNFELQLDRAALRLDGTAALAGVRMAVAAQRNLAADAAQRWRVTLEAALDEAARRALGLDFFPDAVKGTVAADMTYSVPASGPARAQVAIDLGASALALAPLGWHKPAGMPATARLALDFDGARVAAVSNAVFDGGGLTVRLDAAFDTAGGGERLSRLEIAHLVVGATDASATATRGADGAWRIAVSGPSLDASPLMDWLDRFQPGVGAGPPLAFNVRLDRLVLGPARTARDVRANLTSDGVHWQVATIAAALAGGAKLRLRYGKVAGRRRFDLQTDDFGGFARLVGLSDNVKDGKLHVTGMPVDQGGRRRLKLTADGTDFRIVDAPLLARLLSLGSLSGIGALLRGEGIPFTRLRANFVYGEDRIVIDNFRAYGGAIGITGGGTVERAAGTLDVSGTLIPAYTLNTVLGNIPVLGKLLLGGEGQGIFGANYRVAGPLDDPKISVNPLSALAPGFLRRLFLFEPANPAPGAAAPPGGGPKR
ncbi:MAG TPA: AsmA-like C-terminal domain-containing protein [Stellaceae bacterium]|nr:AsmA-like C-terminal domain-containing protein [Stellaceae bacterium]